MIAAIAAARHAAGLTQRELAAKLKRSNSFVWKLEAGERQLNVLEFIEIAQILDVQPSVLLAQFELTPEHVASTHPQEVDPGKINTT